MAETISAELGLSWADILPEAFAKIFSLLSTRVKLMVIPSVCQSWRRVSQDPLCWQTIDLRQWDRDCGNPDEVDRLIKMLVDRSQGCLREFKMDNLRSDATLEYIVRSAPFLQVLHLPFSSITDDCIQRIASKVPCISDLDISYCASLSKVALEAFGEHCRSITLLRRSSFVEISGHVSSNDEEAFAIAQCFPQLRHLEMSNVPLSNKGLKAIFDSCADLEHLDLHGCEYLEMNEAWLKDCRERLKVFYEPHSHFSDSNYGDMYLDFISDGIHDLAYGDLGYEDYSDDTYKHSEIIEWEGYFEHW